MQRTSVCFSLILTVALALPAFAQTESAPAQPQPAKPEVGVAAQPSPAPAPEAQEAVKLTNSFTPVESLARPMVTSGFGFDEARHAPVFGVPAFFQRVLGNPEYRVQLLDPTGFTDFVRDQKLQLSLRSYLDLVLANNTNIAIQKVQLETPKNAIMRSMSFLDPNFTGNFNATRSETPATNQLEGASVLSQLNQPANFNYNQTFMPGTQMQVGLNATRSSNNNQFQNFNPFINTGFNLQVTQPLLRNRGMINRVPILIARNTLQTSELAFENQVINLLSNAELAYWDYLEARENLRVQEAALSLRRESLRRTQRELELGAIPELDVFQPQADFAQAEVNYTQAKFRLARTEDVLRQQMGIDLDPELRKLPIEITDIVTPPSRAEAIDRESYVEVALRSRPDLLQQRQQLIGDDLGIKQSVNQLRPNLALTMRYAGAGRAGDQLVGDPRRIVQQVSLWSALGNTLAFDFPTYSFGLQLALPIRDRQASANYADALVRKKTTMLRIRDLEQTVRLDILNAINNLEASRDSVRLASIAREFAQKRLDAEQKKYDLGTVTLFFLQAAQTDLISNEQRLVTESINYNRNRLALLRLSGTLLIERGVVVK
ncbi:MAG: TolC family protein [Bryobacterales bacterium]|jgi:outer membrane protein TolC|nr:TolC family protein [Bryobacterales bacterium]